MNADNTRFLSAFICVYLRLNVFYSPSTDDSRDVSTAPYDGDDLQWIGSRFVQHQVIRIGQKRIGRASARSSRLCPAPGLRPRN